MVPGASRDGSGVCLPASLPGASWYGLSLPNGRTRRQLNGPGLGVLPANVYKWQEGGVRGTQGWRATSLRLLRLPNP